MKRKNTNHYNSASIHTAQGNNGASSSTDESTAGSTPSRQDHQELVQQPVSHRQSDPDSYDDNPNHGKGGKLTRGMNYNPLVSNNSTFNYHPVVQTNFDMDPLVGSAAHSTQTATSYMDDVEVIQHIGTSHSRKGRYIRQTWQQACLNIRKNRRTSSIWLIAVFVSIVLLTKMSQRFNHTVTYDYNHGHSPSGDDNSGGPGGPNDQFPYDDDDLYTSTTDQDPRNPIHNWKDIRVNDYSHIQLPSNILQPSQSFKQHNFIKNIPKSCLKQDFVQYQRQHQHQHNANIMASLYNTKTSCEPKCSISNPFIPEDKLDSKSWKTALKKNIQLVDEYILKRNTMDVYNNFEHHTTNTINHNNKRKHINLDVVFYGDSIVEQWNGRWMGNDINSKHEIRSVFHQYFDPSHDSYQNQTLNNNINAQSTFDIDTLNGLALGIAGDKTNNLLWRLQHGGELPKELNPKVFWLVIGTNDLTDNCSEDIVILGILAIVKEIQTQRPDSIVVINGLLPRTDRKDGRLVGNMNDEENGDNGDSVDYNTYNDYDDYEKTTSENDAVKINSGMANEEKKNENFGDKHYYDYDYDDGNEHNTTQANNSTTKSTAILISLPPSSSVEQPISTSPSNQTDHNQRHGYRRREESDVNNVENDIFDYWPSIQAINHQLKLYAKQHDKVEFYDPSHLFLARMGNSFYNRNEFFLMKELQDDYLHPTALGHKIWAEAIVDYFTSDLDAPDNL